MNPNNDWVPESPNYEFFQNDELARLDTFRDWNNPVVRPEDLAKAGFVNSKCGDRVECVFCQGLIESWEEGDIPWEEHRRYFPSCPFIQSETLSNRNSRGIDVAGTGRPPTSSRTRKKSVALITNSVISHNFPKYSKFISLESRQESFNSWPHTISVACMAEAGFFYIGKGETDRVKCFHCGASFMEWKENDDPWEEHAKFQPNCELVLLKKGKAYVDRVSKNNHSAAAEIKSPEPTLAQGINDMHVQEPRPTQQHLATIVTSLLPKKQPESKSNHTSTSSHSEVEPSESIGQEFRSCVVCLMQERCITFLPCGHFTACVDCTLKLSDCPVCRQPISSVVRTYMS